MDNNILNTTDIDTPANDSKNEAPMSWEIEKETREAKSIKKIKNAIADIMNELNIMGNEKIVQQGLIEAISRSHRTLQQSFFSTAIVPIIQNYAKQNANGDYDLRNQASCEVAVKLDKALDGSVFPSI